MAKASGTGGKKKTTKTGTRPKSAPRAKAAPKKPAAPAGPAPGSRSMGPAAVLVILALLIVIVFMVNRFYFSGEGTKRADAPVRERREARVAGEDDDDEKSAREDREKDRKEKEAAKAKAGKEGPIERDLRIYLVRFNERTEKTELASVSRRVKAEEPLEAALQELLKGPSGAEKRGGLLSAMPDRLAIRNVTVRNRTAYIDFNDAFEENAIGNIIQSRIDQIVFTATQFDDVEGVVIQVNGATRKFVGGDGVVLNNPLTRKQR
ncbi:MAG: hypothetical protein EPN93_14765 [Spirochaetes bacterium]|nr:MAG: hypothetical protein EPN93_14765 [Spirochaetota bacterium]